MTAVPVLLHTSVVRAFPLFRGVRRKGNLTVGPFSATERPQLNELANMTSWFVPGHNETFLLCSYYCSCIFWWVLGRNWPAVLASQPLKFFVKILNGPCVIRIALHNSVMGNVPWKSLYNVISHKWQKKWYLPPKGTSSMTHTIFPQRLQNTPTKYMVFM